MVDGDYMSSDYIDGWDEGWDRFNHIKNTHLRHLHRDLYDVQHKPLGWDVFKWFGMIKHELHLKHEIKHHKDLHPEEYV